MTEQICPNCKSTDIYFLRGSPVCNHCHPCPDLKLIEQAHKMRFETEKLTLIERCKKGIDVLSQAFANLTAIVPDELDPEKDKKNELWKEGMKKWDEGNLKLRGLVSQLTTMYDYRSCLFLGPDGEPTRACASYEKRNPGVPKKPESYLCWACPVDWEKVIFTRPPEVKPEPASLFGKKIK